MRSLRTFLYACAVVALAACGGGGSSSNAVPPAPNDPGARAPSGNSVEFEKDTLWVSYELQYKAYPSGASGDLTALRSGGTWYWLPTDPPALVDIAIAPESTQWILENRNFAEGGPGWRAFAISPVDGQPENDFGDGVNSPFGIGLSGDGIMVGYRDRNDNLSKIETHPYGASNSAPLRTFVSSKPLYAFAEGYDGFLYVERPAGYEVFRPTSDGTSGLVRRVYTEKPLSAGQRGFTVGRDNSVYVVEAQVSGNTRKGVAYVDVYPPGSGKIKRRIGPFTYDNSDALTNQAPVIAVDKLNRLYVWNLHKIYRYGPNANGNATPGRIMNDPTQSVARAMALGPALQ